MTVGQPENLIALLSGEQKGSRHVDFSGLTGSSGLHGPSSSFQALMDASSMFKAPAYPDNSQQLHNNSDDLYGTAAQASYVQQVPANDPPRQPDAAESTHSDSSNTHAAGTAPRPADGGMNDPRNSSRPSDGGAKPADVSQKSAETHTAKNTRDNDGGKGRTESAASSNDSAKNKTNGTTGPQVGTLAARIGELVGHKGSFTAHAGASRKGNAAAQSLANGVGRLPVAAAKDGKAASATARLFGRATALRVGDLVGARITRNSKITVQDLRSELKGLAVGNAGSAKSLSVMLDTLKAEKGGNQSGTDKQKQKAPGQTVSHIKTDAQSAALRPGSEVAQELARIREQLSEQATDRHGRGGTKQGSDNSAPLTGVQSVGFHPGATPAKGMVPTQSGPYAELARQLKQNLNADIVREAKVILKDNNSGEIRMTLRPESLGRVRIQLHIVDNRIGGRIFVDNMNVKDVFQQNLNQLYQAFQDSGFDTGMLEVAVGNNGDQASHGQYEEGDGAKTSIRAASVGALEKSVPRLLDPASYGESLVNLVV